MFIMKKYFGLVMGALSLYLGLNIFSSYLFAQTNFFPLGLFNYDVRGREYTIDQANEIANIDGLHANYLTEMSYHAQEGMIDSCTTRFAGTIRTELVHDTTGGHYPIPGELSNLMF